MDWLPCLMPQRPPLLCALSFSKAASAGVFNGRNAQKRKESREQNPGFFTLPATRNSRLMTYLQSLKNPPSLKAVRSKTRCRCFPATLCSGARNNFAGFAYRAILVSDRAYLEKPKPARLSVCLGANNGALIEPNRSVLSNRVGLEPPCTFDVLYPNNGTICAPLRLAEPSPCPRKRPSGRVLLVGRTPAGVGKAVCMHSLNPARFI